MTPAVTALGIYIKAGCEHNRVLVVVAQVRLEQDWRILEQLPRVHVIGSQAILRTRLGDLSLTRLVLDQNILSI